MKAWIALIALSLAAAPAAQAQVLKKLGNKVEKKLNERVERKVDRSIDKVLDKADKETDKPLDNALNQPASTNKAHKEVAKEATRDGNTTVESEPVREASPGEGSVMLMAGGSCADFIWFREDAMIEFTYHDANAKLINQTRMTVTEVQTTGEGTIALVRSSGESGHSFDLKMVCSGGNLYMDFGSLMKQALAQSGQAGIDTSAFENTVKTTEISFDDAFLVFPDAFYAGQYLPDAEVTIKTSPAPQMTLEITSTLSGRKVEAKETIQTPAGQFECIKISGRRHTRMKVMGMDKVLDGGTEYLWFAPGIGVIRQDTYDDKDKLQGSMLLSAFRR
ncbi:MAG TPA: hypothetical protein VNQ80_08865 [Parapedobacter sp.]|uniref:TapB family protein n=1 Tax=Parapedobacter sp. TaxID=1958893 RepID=UPI002C641795|nr:hypothetical protein [Parapedobacter sp.]HWK57435.1 hypothetical protein [Parapedobacter sp.]